MHYISVLKEQTINAVRRYNRCLFQDPYKTSKYNVLGSRRIFEF